jgi:hypothetical protein
MKLRHRAMQPEDIPECVDILAITRSSARGMVR